MRYYAATQIWIYAIVANLVIVLTDLVLYETYFLVAFIIMIVSIPLVFLLGKHFSILQKIFILPSGLISTTLIARARYLINSHVLDSLMIVSMSIPLLILLFKQFPIVHKIILLIGITWMAAMPMIAFTPTQALFRDFEQVKVGMEVTEAQSIMKKYTSTPHSENGTDYIFFCIYGSCWSGGGDTSVFITIKDGKVTDTTFYLD